MKKMVLATSWHPGGVNAIVPVIKKLSEEKQVEVVTVGHEYAIPILQKNNIEFKRLEDFGLKDVSLPSVNSLLRKISPDLVLTGTSAQDKNRKDVLEQSIALATKEHNISSLAVLDFWKNYSLRFSDIYTGEKLKFLPEIIAVMDSYAKEDMVKEGFDESKLVVTGNPHFDNLELKGISFTTQEKNYIQQKIGLDSQVSFFYAANAWKKEKESMGYWDLENLDLMNKVLSQASKKNKKNYQVFVKLHPRVPQEDFCEISDYINKTSSKNFKVVTDIDPQDLILATDITVTPFSTLGIEALYMGKPCISVQPNVRLENAFTFFSEKGLVPLANSIETVMDMVEKSFLDDSYREKVIPQMGSPLRTGGNATKKVVELVYQTLNE